MDKQYRILAKQVKAAYRHKRAFNICGAHTKAFYGEEPKGIELDTSSNEGIIDYDPAELVIVVRAGTRLDDIQHTLGQSGQMLGFEPPFAHAGATIGGAVASGLAGSSRPYRGGVRDYLLGAKILNGKGECLQFGGRVMKNVAGFDLFRPMAGAMGTLGVLLDVSLRVIPTPSEQISLRFSLNNQAKAIEAMSSYAKSLVSISAAAWIDGMMYIRLSGTQPAIERDHTLLSQQTKHAETNSNIWPQLASFKHDFFQKTKATPNLLSINIPAATKPLSLEGDQIIDWAGGRRYIKTSSHINEVRANVVPLGGSVSGLFCADRKNFFQPVPLGLNSVHQRLKKAFDPGGVLNPGRLYPDL